MINYEKCWEELKINVMQKCNYGFFEKLIFNDFLELMKTIELNNYYDNIGE